MSASAALQIAVIAALRANIVVAGYLGQRIWDNAPSKPAAVPPYLTLGPAQELDDSAECIDGVECFQQIDIWTQAEGSQLSAKADLRRGAKGSARCRYGSGPGP